jgi:hypothetical protein
LSFDEALGRRAHIAMLTNPDFIAAFLALMKWHA